MENEMDDEVMKIRIIRDPNKPIMVTREEINDIDITDSAFRLMLKITANIDYEEDDYIDEIKLLKKLDYIYDTDDEKGKN